MTAEDSLQARRLGEFFAYLGGDETIRSLAVTERFWSEEVGTLSGGHLLSSFRTDADWTSWEMHPAGDELILQLAGAMELIVEHTDGREERLRLNAGEFTIVPPGAWHTAEVVEPGEAVYLTRGEGTEHRPRS